MTTALITGITGQDGSYLAELLLGKGYRVIGLSRPGSRLYPTIADHVEVVEGDLLSQSTVSDILRSVQPDEVYHLASQSSPSLSRHLPLETADTNALGTLRMLDGIRDECPDARFFNASTSEVFANTETSPQNESTEYAPRNTYGASKVFGQMTTTIYRETIGLHASSGIMYNHESPRRGSHFVTRKISIAAAEISLGMRSTVELGDLSSRRDWGFAGDYVVAMWLMLQQHDPADYIIGTGTTYSVEDFCQCAFGEVGLQFSDHVVQNPKFMRSPETTVLESDPRKAKERLEWTANTSFAELVATMVQADVRRLTDGQSPD